MVEVGVGCYYEAGLGPQIHHELPNPVWFVSRVDDERFFPRLEDVAVCLEPSNHEGVDFDHANARLWRLGWLPYEPGMCLKTWKGSGETLQRRPGLVCSCFCLCTWSIRPCVSSRQPYG